MKNSIKIMLLSILTILSLFIIYSLIPRVFHKSSPYGKGLVTSNYLLDETQREIDVFIQDSVKRIETIVSVKNGEIIYELGNTKKLINTRSVRKSIMNLLYGIAIEKGLLSLDMSLKSLGIDESKTPLTAQEKTATIRDLLMARSGIFIQAEGEVHTTTKNRPNRDQYKPGEYFLYNNFDFNVLGFILEQQTNMSIGDFMEEYLAKPLELQDFASSNVVYNSPWPISSKSGSDYPAYWIYMSTRDLAKIGVLVCQNGNWNGKQIVTPQWIEESTQPYTKYADYQIRQQQVDAYGYLWKIDLEEDNIWADGYGGQFMIIDIKNKLITAQMNPNGNSLLSSGLYLMDKERDNVSKNELMAVHNKILTN